MSRRTATTLALIAAIVATLCTIGILEEMEHARDEKRAHDATRD